MGAVGGRREDVDDRATTGELAAVLDELLAAVADGDEAGAELVGIEHVARSDDDRLDLRAVRAEPLRQRADAGDHDRRTPRGIPEPPEHAQPAAHRLDARTHPLERQRLPRREQLDLIGSEELREVLGELSRHGARRDGDHERATRRRIDQPGNGQRSRRLGDRDHRRGAPEQLADRRLVAKELGERGQVHGRVSRVPPQPGRLPGGIRCGCTPAWRRRHHAPRSARPLPRHARSTRRAARARPSGCGSGRGWRRAPSRGACPPRSARG